MTRFRFSLLTLAGATAAFAVGCASLVNASEMVSRLVWGATLLCLTFALLCAILAAPVRRGFWSDLHSSVGRTCSSRTARCPTWQTLLPWIRG
jgi:hypothetical protein